MKTLLLLLFCTIVNANEQILDFHANIQVLDSGDVIVTETIKVNVENRNIRHGIYRSTPTIYYGTFFTHRNSNISILKTELDGSYVDHHIERLTNGIRVYLGSKESYVSKGIHSYQIQYISERQILDNPTNDSLYWNITGNNWDFPILKASADIYLPSIAEFNDINAYTGYMGDKEQNFTYKKYSDYLHFETTKPLEKHQGITILTTWKKGIISNRDNSIWAFIKDNLFWFLSIILLISFPVFFYISWKMVGIDPPRKPIFPRFKPPLGVSPAAVRYISKNYFDGKSFSCAMMSLAVKNYITIKQKSKKHFIFMKVERRIKDKYSNGEKAIYDQLFYQNKTLSINGKYNSKVENAYDSLKFSLKDEYQKLCYMDNNKFWYFGVALSMLALFLNWGHFFNFSNYAVSQLITAETAIALSAFGLVKSKKPYMKVFAVLVPASITLAALYTQHDKIYFAFMTIILAIFVINALFYYLIQAPTVFGRKLLDKIHGFRMYLATAEQDRLELMHPPEMTPELFEKYLPYALALGVENSWSEQFSNAMEIQGKDVNSYRPKWYVGNNYSSFDYSSTASTIGSGLASSVASSTTPPSSSGGGGFGGGYSGGGGGGGGGGGW